MKYTYKIRQSIYKDAWNWWSACNHASHGVNWKKQINDELANKLVGKTQKEANKILIPFLKKVHIKEKKNLSQAKRFFKKEFEKKFQDGCNKIEKAMGKPIYRKDFTIYLTTLRRGPYYKSKGIVWTCIYWDDPVRTFLHELCHFQFIHYWRENPDTEVSKLSNDRFEYLKESLTMILDESFFPIIKKPDYGYDLHQNFRKDLKKFWQKKRDFDQLVDLGMKRIKSYNLTTGKKKMPEKYKSDKRAVGVIIKDDKILLLRRVKDGEGYFVFPGGSVEKGESIEDAVIRELKEELCIEAKLDKFLFDFYVAFNSRETGRTSHFFLVKEFLGEPKLGGPEKERMNENNQYYPEWHSISKALVYPTLFPEEARTRLRHFLSNDGQTIY